MITIRIRSVALLAIIVVGLLACDMEALSGVHDLDGQPVNPLQNSTAPITVTLFVDSDCPVSNRYAPQLQSLQQRYSPRGVSFWLVYPDPRISVSTIRAHMRDYGYAMPALRDPEHALVRRANVRVTPEAGIFLADGTLVYHGRIDNRYVDLSRRRPQATEHDVEDVLDALLEGKSVDNSWIPAPGRPLNAMSRPGVGCYIQDFK